MKTALGAVSDGPTGLSQTIVPPLYGRDSPAQPERYLS